MNDRVLALARIAPWSHRSVRDGADRRFKFNKPGQLFIRVHNETLPVVAMSVRNEDRPPVEIHQLRNIATRPLRLSEAKCAEIGSRRIELCAVELEVSPILSTGDQDTAIRQDGGAVFIATGDETAGG